MSQWRQLGLLIVVLGFTAFVLGAACTPSSSSSSAAAPPMSEFDQQRSWDDLVKQVKFGFRIPGTKPHVATRDWLAAQLKACTPSVSLQPFTHHRLMEKTVPMWNIIADLPGAGVAPREKVLLCAHWDSRPFSDHDLDPSKRKTPIDGADDGASGVAVLLEIARQLHARPIARDVEIVLFDGEDYGPGIEDMLLGSQYYAAHLPAAKPSWGILLDMVGYKDLAIYREPSSEEAAKAVNDRVFHAARELGYLRAGELTGFVDALYQYEITDDHTPLNKAGVPTADLIDFDYPPWHTTGDTIDKCSAESLKIVGKTVLYAIQE